MKQWHKVQVPKPWRPKPTEELIGTYVGSKQMSGKFGVYTIHMIRRQKGSVAYVSGTMASALFAVVELGCRVKLVFNGYKVALNGNEYKDYELYVEDEMQLKVTG